MNEVRGKLDVSGRQALDAIVNWLGEHNLLGRSTYGLEHAFAAGSLYPEFPGLVLLLRFGHNDLAYVFDPSYGGSQHLINDFEKEGLKPLGLRLDYVDLPNGHAVGVFRAPGREGRPGRGARRNPYGLTASLVQYVDLLKQYAHVLAVGGSTAAVRSRLEQLLLDAGPTHFANLSVLLRRRGGV